MSATGSISGKYSVALCKCNPSTGTQASPSPASPQRTTRATASLAFFHKILSYYYLYRSYITDHRKCVKSAGYQQVSTVYCTPTITVAALVYFLAVLTPTSFSGVTKVPYQIMNYTRGLDSNGSERLAGRRKQPRNPFSGKTKEE